MSAFIAGMLVSLVMSYIVYFGFTTNYTRWVFSEESFLQQYNHDVYKYRIFSKYLLLQTDRLLNILSPDRQAEPRLQIIDQKATDHFYYSYFLLNLFFLMASSIVLTFILEIKTYFSWTTGEKRLLSYFLPVLICLTQFVICPYDVCSYFFQLLTIYIFFEYFNRYFYISLLGIGLLIILATLNRETSYLTVAYMILILLVKQGMKIKGLLSIGWFSICFLVSYLSLRYFIKDSKGWHSPDTIDKFQLNLNWDFSHWGIIFWVIFGWLSFAISRSRENRRLILFYYLACLPYIVICLISGVLWELRLFIPLFIGSILLSTLNTNRFQSPLAITARKAGLL